MTILNAANAAVMVLGIGGAFVLGRPEEWRKWGFLIALAAQPLWLYIAHETGVWSLTVLALLYTAMYVQGAWHHIFVPWRSRTKNMTPDECEACPHYLTPWSCNGGTDEYPCPRGA